jgi:3',5'-cyclic AMP phosphodiesterase CpdA
MSFSLRIAHFSDPHFAKATFHPRQFLSKRWIGNFNALFFRSAFYDTEQLLQLPSFFASMHVEATMCTGDFTTTSQVAEFEQAAQFLHQFETPPYIVPGNHDCYTKEDEREQPFYRCFHLEKKQVTVKKIAPGFWWIGLDCAVATPPFNAYGEFTKPMQAQLEAALSTIARTDCVIMANHFPLFPHNKPKHDLKGVELLQQTLKKYPKVQLYLHGHDHVHYEIDGHKEGLPLVFNSGSCARKKRGGFSLFDLTQTHCVHHRYEFEKVGNCAVPTLIYERTYSLR